MPFAARVPPRLAFVPFRASAAIADGILTRAMLRGSAWQRLLPDVYVHQDALLAPDHRLWCDAVALLLPPVPRSPDRVPPTCGALTCWPATRQSVSFFLARRGCARTRGSPSPARTYQKAI